MVKNSPAKTGDMGSIPGWGRSPGGGNGNLLQYSCQDNLMDKGIWWASRKDLDTTEQLRHHACTQIYKHPVNLCVNFVEDNQLKKSTKIMALQTAERNSGNRAIALFKKYQVICGF